LEGFSLDHQGSYVGALEDVVVSFVVMGAPWTFLWVVWWAAFPHVVHCGKPFVDEFCNGVVFGQGKGSKSTSTGHPASSCVTCLWSPCIAAGDVVA